MKRGALRGLRTARDFRESEATARARAERDPATRLRITNAADHLGEAHGVDPTTVRRLHQDGMGFTIEQVHRAGLTMGEARAAGLRVIP